MLDIEVKTEAVMKRFETMLDEIKTFGHDDMPQGMTDWQTEDMHRKYPETALDESNAPDRISAFTEIFPRSRTYERAHPFRGRPVAFRKPVLSSMPRLLHSIIRHPILRPELLDKFYSRMVALLDEKIQWR